MCWPERALCLEEPCCGLRGPFDSHRGTLFNLRFCIDLRTSFVGLRAFDHSGEPAHGVLLSAWEGLFSFEKSLFRLTESSVGGLRRPCAGLRGLCVGPIGLGAGLRDPCWAESALFGLTWRFISLRGGLSFWTALSMSA